MEGKDLAWIIANCRMQTASDSLNQTVLQITPKYAKDLPRLNALLAAEHFKNDYPTLEEFSKLAQSMKEPARAYMYAEQVQQKSALNQLQTSDSASIAQMSNAQKAALLDRLVLPLYGPNDMQNFNLNMQALQSCPNKVRDLLFGIDFPKEFMKDEFAKNDRFNHLLCEIPALKPKLNNYQNLNTEDRLAIASGVVDVFQYVYGVKDICLNTFTDDDYQRTRPNDQRKQIPTGYADDNNTIWLNTDRLKESDNFVIVQMVYHEALHLYQNVYDFSQYPNMTTLFSPKFSIMGKMPFETEIYPLTPHEQHAYNMDRQTVDFLKNEMGITYIPNKYNDSLKQTVQNIRDKGYAAFDHKVYRAER